jgi:hypothetical protein
MLKNGNIVFAAFGIFGLYRSSSSWRSRNPGILPDCNSRPVQVT